MAASTSVTPTASRVDPDSYYAITVTWKSGIGYQVPCRGRQLQSYLTRCENNVWLQSFVPREITQSQYQLLMYGPEDASVPNVKKAVAMKAGQSKK